MPSFDEDAQKSAKRTRYLQELDDLKAWIQSVKDTNDAAIARGDKPTQSASGVVDLIHEMRSTIELQCQIESMLPQPVYHVNYVESPQNSL